MNASPVPHFSSPAPPEISLFHRLRGLILLFSATLCWAAGSMKAQAAGAPAEQGKEKGKDTEAITSSLQPDDLAGFPFWPQPVQAVIAYGLSLTPRGLGYEFGSSDPEAGGMDCSGTLYHVLQHQGLKDVPRQSDEMFDWIADAGLLHKVSGTPAQDDPVLADLRPGDLLFWTGTYDTGSRSNPISHVMMYLGKTTEGSPVMFGASNGRSYQGKRQNGVSVFDFRMPSAEGKARFVGYGPVPGLDTLNVQPQPPTQGRPTDTAQAVIPGKKPGDSKKSEDSPAPEKSSSNSRKKSSTRGKPANSSKPAASSRSTDDDQPVPSKKSSNTTKRPASKKRSTSSKSG